MGLRSEIFAVQEYLLFSPHPPQAVPLFQKAKAMFDCVTKIIKYAALCALSLSKRSKQAGKARDDGR